MKRLATAGNKPKQGMEQHRDIILEALRDYRRWWADEPEDERVKEIYRAIAFIETS